MERDKFLTEVMGGKIIYQCVVDGECDPILDCVRQKECKEPLASCVHGHESTDPHDCEYWRQAKGEGNESFSTWSGFGRLMKWAQVQRWWHPFLTSHHNCCICHLFDPDRFANAVCEFLKERG